MVIECYPSSGRTARPRPPSGLGIMFRVARLAMAFLAGLSLCVAGPFGIDGGDDLPEGSEPHKNSDTICEIDVPLKHPALDGYSALWHRDHGICAIAGHSGPVRRTDPGETKLEEAFDIIPEQLSGLYGKPTRPINHSEGELQSYWLRTIDSEVQSVMLWTFSEETERYLMAFFAFADVFMPCMESISAESPKPRRTPE